MARMIGTGQKGLTEKNKCSSRQISLFAFYKFLETTIFIFFVMCLWKPCYIQQLIIDLYIHYNRSIIVMYKIPFYICIKGSFMLLITHL